MVNLKNNHGLKVSIYISDITGYPMVITDTNMDWYNNSSCRFDKLCDYQERIAKTFCEVLESLQDESTPLSNDTILERLTREVINHGFTYDFSKVVD